MKPHRVRLTHELISAYQLDRKLAMNVNHSRLTTPEITKFHSDECALPPVLAPGVLSLRHSSQPHASTVTDVPCSSDTSHS